MSDPTYGPKNYQKDGGDTHVVASGGVITVESGGVIDVLTGGVIKANGTQASDVGALTDNSGGAAADGTIGAVTAPTAITDSTTGTTTTTLQPGAGVSVHTVPFTFTTSTAAINVMNALTLGYKFKVLSWSWVDGGTALVGGSGSRVANLTISGTAVGTTPSTVTVVQASTAPGRRIDGTAVSGANTGTASDTLSVVIASGGTDITAGNGSFQIKIQNMDTADALAGFATAQAANRTAIVALTDAVKELSTKANLLRLVVQGGGLTA